MKKIILSLLSSIALSIYSCSPPSYEELKEKKLNLQKRQGSIEEFEQNVNDVIDKRVKRLKFVEDSLLIESKKRTIVSYNKSVNMSILPDTVTKTNKEFYYLLKGINDERERSVKLDSLLSK
jgi:hypothetical protein